MTQFGPSIEADPKNRVQGQAPDTRFITAEHRTNKLPVPSGCASYYATDADITKT